MIQSSLINDRVALGAFDFDGNILAPNSWCYVINMATGKEEKIIAHHLDQNTELLGGPNPKYKLHPYSEHSFAHFRDFSTRPEHIGADHLIQDVQDALEQGLFAPSFESFKKTFLIRARFFGIITARGHSAENLARAMSAINEAILSPSEKELQYSNIKSLWTLFGKKGTPGREEALDFYFQDIGMYYGVSSPHLCKMIGIDKAISSSEKKTQAMAHLIMHTKKMINAINALKNTSLAIGFSDDSIGNIERMSQFFVEQRKEESLITPNDKIRVYFTGKQDQLHMVPNRDLSIEKQDNNITKIII